MIDVQPHLKINRIETCVLLPGDAGRIDKILKYLSDVKEVNVNREFRTCNSGYGEIRLSMVSSGIGCPAAAIAVEELANVGAKTLIRIGTCGGFLKEMQPGDIVILSSAFCGDGTTREYSGVRQVDADNAVFSALVASARKLGVRYFVGVNRTHMFFMSLLKIL